jgi:hypothetical protein
MEAFCADVIELFFGIDPETTAALIENEAADIWL